MFLHLLMQLVISQARKAASGKLVPGLQSLETNDALFFGASWRHVFNWEKGRCNGRKKLWGHRLVGFSSSKHNIRNLLNMCLLKIFECVEYAVEPQASLRSQTNANNTHGPCVPCVPCVPCRSGSPLVQSASPFQSLPVPSSPFQSWPLLHHGLKHLEMIKDRGVSTAVAFFLVRCCCQSLAVMDLKV